jgi:1-acyl-sn-glycerol-3-phosphate acyltransferase
MNHLSRLDPAVAYVTIDREDMTALVADKYKATPGISWLVNIFNGIWVNREDVDMKAIRAARDYLRSGGALGIAPEGTRSQTKALIQAKTGVAYLADKAQVPLVPIAIWGSERAFRDLAHFRQAKINIRFGKPFNLEPLDRMDRNGSLQRNTDEIMCRIAAMLPPEYWGEYANHPRLRELIQENQEIRSLAAS